MPRQVRSFHEGSLLLRFAWRAPAYVQAGLRATLAYEEAGLCAMLRIPHEPAGTSGSPMAVSADVDSHTPPTSSQQIPVHAASDSRCQNRCLLFVRSVSRSMQHCIAPYAWSIITRGSSPYGVGHSPLHNRFSSPSSPNAPPPPPSSLPLPPFLCSIRLTTYDALKNLISASQGTYKELVDEREAELAAASTSASKAALPLAAVKSGK